jgi:hypothetical protein
METVLLETIETFNNSDYDDEWDVFNDWFDASDPLSETVWAYEDNWEQMYTFQLFVREARKDE